MWLWVILSCFKSITYNKTLEMNTANAGMVFMHAITPAHKDVLMVAKFQVDTESDDIVVDNISGYIINVLPLFNHVRRHFMTYMDSCLTFIQLKRNKGKLSATFDLHMLASAHKHTIDDATNTCVKLNLAYVVNSPMALKDAFLDYMSEETHEYLVRKVGELLGALYHMGITYGFIHNDLHFGNILLDREAETLVIIDYGRVHFDTNKLSKDVLEKIEERIAFEELKNTKRSKHNQHFCESPNPTPIDYNVFCSAKAVYTSHDFMMHAYKNGFDLAARSVFMFDIMTVSMNVIRMLCKESIDKLDFCNCFIFDNMSSANKITHIKSFPAIRQMIERARTLTSKRIMTGIFWFSFFVQFIYEHKHRKQIFDIDQFFYYEARYTEEFIFRSMQLIDIPNYSEFGKYVKTHQKHVVFILDVLEKTAKASPSKSKKLVGRIGGGNHLINRASVSEMLTINRAPKSHFKHLYKAYCNSGQ
jgi:hypothetical protein